MGSPAVVPLSIITARPAPGVVRVYLAGEIDLATASQLRVVLFGVVAAEATGADVRVDLSGVTFIDAIGVGVLVRAKQAALTAGLGMSVHNPRGIVRRIMDLLGMHTLLDIPESDWPAAGSQAADDTV